MNNIIDTISKAFGKKDDEKTPIGSSFKELVENVAKNGGGVVKLYRKDEESNARFFVAERDVGDMKNVEPEQWIKNGYGGGNYIVSVIKENEKGVDKIAKDFRFSIVGEPKEGTHEANKRKNADQQMATSMTESVLNFAEKLMPKKDDSAIIVLIQAMMQQFMDSQKSQLEMMMRMYESSKKDNNPISETLNGIMQLSQVKDMLTPNVTEDKTLEWAKLLMGSQITAGLMGKIAGVEIPVQKSLPLEEAQVPGSNRLGAPIKASVTTPPEQTHTAPHLIESIDEKDDFELIMIAPIIELINSKAEPAEIAQSIHQVINWTLTSIRANIEPHPLMAEFIRAIIEMANGNLDLKNLDIAYMNFAQNIDMPLELIDPVKDELIKLYMPTLLQMKASKPPTITVETDGGANEADKPI